MKLECMAGEDPDTQCEIIEDGIRCGRGVKVKDLGLCTKHYGRFNRNGSFENHRKVKRLNRLKRAEQQMLQENKSIICVCTHRYHLHIDKVKSAMHCTVDGCYCNHFAGVDMFAVQRAVNRMNKLGFAPLNKTAICLRCKQIIPCGPWHDGHVFYRLIDHLRTHQVRRSELSSYRSTG